MIEVFEVSKHYGAQKALDRVSLRFPAGKVTILAGMSGSGKSTLLKILNRLVEPDGGKVTIDGVDIRSQVPEDLRRNLGWVIQSTGLFPHFTVAENIATVPRLLKWPADRIQARVAQLVDLVRLPRAFLTKFPHELSGGEAQRVGVARALGADPPVLLMDEPFGSLDPQTRLALQDEFLNLQSQLKKTVILVTHELDEALKLGDHLALLDQGLLLAFDTPERLQGRGGRVGEFLGRDYDLKLLSRRHPLSTSPENLGPSSRDLLVEMIAQGQPTVQTASGQTVAFADLVRPGTP